MIHLLRAGLFLILVYPAFLFAQKTDARLTADYRNIPLAEVLDDIARKTGVRFSYNPSEIKADRTVSLRVRNRPVEQALRELLDPADIRIEKVGDYLVLKPARAGVTPTEPIRPETRVRRVVCGYVRDKATGDALAGANVRVVGTSAGITTNNYGFFSLTLGQGTIRLAVSYLGFGGAEKQIELQEDITLFFELEEVKQEIEEVEIVAAPAAADPAASTSGGMLFSRKSLQQMPGFGGNIDIIRALQAVPGLHTFGDGSALYFVRGGNSDQNLLLFDEVPVYNPSHLFGFFSAFAPEAIGSLQIFKGDFPARFGGRLSSVIDLKGKEGNLNRYGASGNIGAYASTLSVEGPIVKDRAGFLLSGRISTLNWLGSTGVFDRSFDFRFFDINAKFHARLNEKNKLFLTVYAGQDQLSPYRSPEVNSLGISWDNLAATLRWNRLFGRKLFTNTTANYSRYNYHLSLPQKEDGNWNSSVSHVTLKSDVTWYLRPSVTLRSGAEVTRYASDPGNVTLDDGRSNENVPKVSRYQSMMYVAYASAEHTLRDRLTVRYGIRLPAWQSFGPADICYFDANYRVIDTVSYRPGTAYTTAFSPEPRISASFRMGRKSEVHAGYSRMTQFLQSLSNGTGPFTSLDVWIPVGPNIDPQTADHVTAGYRLEMPGGWHFSADGYWKWFRNRIDYRDHASLLFNTLVEGELRPGKGKAYGVELMIRRETGRLTGWIGYTWSRSWVQAPGVNDGKDYPASFDRPHDLCVHLAWNDGNRWNLTATWIYLAGNPLTTPVGFYTFNGVQVPVYGGRNNGRLPDYHRLDLAASCRLGKPGAKYRHSLTATLYNAYGRLNPFSTGYNKFIDDRGDFAVPANLDGKRSLVPSSLSVAGMIPSLNYIFSF